MLPLDDRFGERSIPELAGRPQLVRGKRQMLFAGMGRLPETAIVSDKNRSHAISAELEVLAPGPEGVIIAQGGMTGGWSFYVRAGCLKYAPCVRKEVHPV